MKPRFDELLPFYVNGTLSADDRSWVETYLSEHPVARAELQWYESLQTKLREDVPAVSSEVGLERAMQRIRTEGPVPAGARRAAVAPPAASPFARVRDWLASIIPQPMLKPAFAGALAIVALQAVVIGALIGERDDSTEMRTMKPTVVEKGPYLKVNFKADARETDIRMLLIEVRGSLAAGPGQLGDYYVRVPEQQLSGITDKVAASAIVDSVAVVDALPDRP
jgi:hypothetical protein